MKKTIFTVCSVVTVCAAIVMSCEKEDNSSTKVYYNSQSGYSTGGNPSNTGGGGTSTGVVTSTSGGTSSSGTSTTGSSGTGTTGSTTGGTTSSGSLVTDGTSYTGVTGSGTTVFGNYDVIGSHTSSSQIIDISFATTSAPPAGTYTITGNVPTTGQCQFTYQANSLMSMASSGIVTIITGSSNKAQFSGVAVTGQAGSHTVSGTIYY